jgi:hypothetical protein
MLIQYKTTRSKREVTRECGQRIIAAGIAVRVSKPRKPRAETVASDEQKPKREYKRRDMQAEG